MFGQTNLPASFKPVETTLQNLLNSRNLDVEVSLSKLPIEEDENNKSKQKSNMKTVFAIYNRGCAKYELTDQKLFDTAFYLKDTKIEDFTYQFDNPANFFKSLDKDLFLNISNFSIGKEGYEISTQHGFNELYKHMQENEQKYFFSSSNSADLVLAKLNGITKTVYIINSKNFDNLFEQNLAQNFTFENLKSRILVGITFEFDLIWLSNSDICCLDKASMVNLENLIKGFNKSINTHFTIVE